MDLSQVWNRLAIAAAKILAADTAIIWWPGEGDRLSAVAACETVTALPLSVPADEAEPMVPGYASVLCAPLSVGRLCVYSLEPRCFTPEEKSRLDALADLGSVVIQAVQALADLERTEAAKTEFIRITTHELRSPITVAQSLIRNILKGYAGPLTEKQRDIFSRVAGRLDFLETLINDLLDLAASRTPELAEKEGPVALNASVGRAALLLQPQAEEKGISFVTRLGREELIVWATEDGLDRVFTNLISNAVKYTPPGGSITISVERIGEQARVQVSDTGIGIPVEALPHLFKEFYRAPNARQFAIGTGLGLVIVKELVERYKGTIHVESEVNKGTTFTVSFPLWQPESGGTGTDPE